MTEHGCRWYRRTVAALLSTSLALGGIGTHVAAQEAATSAVVPIAAVGADGLAGLALLMPAAGGGTNVQIIVSGAPTGTFAVIHGGTCAAIDPTPVALLGDVSTMTQVAVGNAIETLADGAHVLALHPGLDLASVVGCGAIPMVAGGPPAPTPEPATTQPSGDGGSFTGPITGFTIFWPADWERYEVSASDAEDRIGLSRGTTSILLAVSPQPGADPQACVRNARQELFDRLDQGSLRDLAPLTTADGSAIGGVEVDRAWLAYRYVSLEPQGEFDLADYLECRTSADHLLFVLHRSTPDTYDAAEREALLAGLTLPQGERVPTPSPSNAACEGYEPWHEGTMGRVDELQRLKSEVNDATNDAMLAFSLTEFKRVLRRVARDLSRMRLDQQGAVAPPAGAQAQQRAVDMFAAFQKSADLLSEYYETSTDRPTFERATAAQRAADKAQITFNEAIALVEGACS